MSIDDARELLAKLSHTDLAYLRAIRNGENPLMSAARLNTFKRHSLLHVQGVRVNLTTRGHDFLRALDGGSPSPDEPQAA